MLKQERQTFILREINVHNRVLSLDLCKQLAVSEDTIRRDLTELDENNQIVKVHGGALSKSFHFNYTQSEVYALEEKKIIAQKTSFLIKDGMHILLGGGTTIVQVVRSLSPTLNATFYTVSLMTALQLCDHPNAEVIFLGESISKNTQIAKGSEVVSRLNEIKMDLCLLGANSIDLHFGITDSDYDTVQVKKAMIRASKKTGIVTIAEKLETVKRFQVCDLKDIEYLITETDAHNEVLSKYALTSIKVL